MPELFDMNDYGDFYVPSEVVQFLVELTDFQPGDKVLAIGFYSNLVKSAVENRENIDFKDIRSSIHPRDLDSLDDHYDVILCAPTFGTYFENSEQSLVKEKLAKEQDEINEEFWLKWSVSHLNIARGRLAIIVPNGLLSNYTHVAAEKRWQAAHSQISS